jgi:hypothetical protein
MALCKFDNYAGKGVYFYFIPVSIQLAVPFKRQENRKKDGLLERKSFYILQPAIEKPKYLSSPYTKKRPLLRA